MPLLELKHVTKEFNGRVIINDLSFVFPNKGLIAIKGKSGSGKSTLLNLLLGLIKPSKGSILFRNKNIFKLKSNDLYSFRSSNISIVFQNYNLLENLTAFENVWLAASVGRNYSRRTRSKINGLFEQLGISYLKDKKVLTLSGGEKQRVAIIRALINNPSVILADEPTGALDVANSKNIMDILKDISKEKLVIMVSHNDNLIEDYSDSILELRNGKLSGSVFLENEEKQLQKNKKGSSFWVPRILFKHLSEDRLINALFISSFTVCLVSALISFGFYNGSSKAISGIKEKSLQYYSAYVSEKTYIEIEGSPLRLVKQQRPSIESIKDSFSDISFFTIHDDLSFYFPSANSFSINSDPQEPCEFVPIYDVTLAEFGKDLLKNTSINLSNNEHTIIVNEQFENQYKCAIGDKIELKTNYYLGNDSYEVNWTLFIAGIVKEFSFLNNPKIYYSYQGVHAYLSSLVKGDDNLISRLENASPTSDESCYRYLIFLHKQKYANSFYKRIEEINSSNSFLNIDSNCFEIASAFENLTQSFALCLSIFSVISAVCSCFIVGIVSYSNFIKRKKEAAIILTLGASIGNIEDVFSFEAIINGLVASFISVPISWIFQLLANYFVERSFMLTKMIDISISSYKGVVLLIPLICTTISVLLCYLSSSIPLSVMHKLPLQEELRDE